MRTVIVWLYNSTGKSVFATILYHTSDNVSWSLFPNYGSHYDPFITGLITTLVAFAVIAVDKGNTFIRNQKHQAGTIYERPEDSNGC
jgi:uncharacterized protein